MDYTGLIQMLAQACVKALPPYDPTLFPAEFTAALPRAIDYAEQRICTDLPMLGVMARNSTMLTAPGNRTLSMATMQANAGGGPIIVPTSFAIIGGGPGLPASGGTRLEFIRASQAVVDMTWPSEAQTVPYDGTLPFWQQRFWALDTNNNIIFCPTADNLYTVEIYGLFRPLPISATNPNTYTSQTYPALLMTACMVFLAGELKQNYGAQMDSSGQAVSWEGQYEALMNSAKEEEARRRGLVPNNPMPPKGG